MKKVLSALVLTSSLAILLVPALLVPTTVLAAVCSQSCGSNSALCTCGSSSNTVAGEYCCGTCNSGRGFSYVSQTECQNALAAAGGTTGDTDEGYREIPTNVPSTPGELVALIRTIGNWVFSGLLGIAALMLILAGYFWITAMGNPEGVKKGSDMLRNALIGVAIALGAKGLVAIIEGLILK